MAVSTSLCCLALVICVSVTLASPVTTTTTTTTPSPSTTDDTSTPIDDTIIKAVDDIKTDATQLISEMREFVSAAKQGMALSAISQGAQEIRDSATEFLEQLPPGASRCETNLVIKMAAAGIGSREVLTLLQAEDELHVLNGRLSLSLAYLESVARLMEDELALSAGIGGHLAAIIVGTNMTASIAQSSDALLKASTSKVNSVIKRQNLNVSASPFYTKPTGFGASANIAWKSKNGGTSASLSPSWTKAGGWAATGKLNWQSKNGGTSVSLTPSWSKNGGFGVLAGVKINIG